MRVFAEQATGQLTLTVYLELESGKCRMIGALDEDGDGTFFTHRAEEHVFRASDAWGISELVLDAFKFRWICVTDDTPRAYWTTREYLLRYGFRREFAEFEPQWFLPRGRWYATKAGAEKIVVVDSKEVQASLPL